MDRIVQSGSAWPILKSVEESDNTRTGKTSVVEAEGSYAECIAKKSQWLAMGASEFDGPKSSGNGFYVVRAVFPFGFNGVVTSYPMVLSVHELRTAIMNTPIWRTLKVRRYLTAPCIGIVQRVFADYQAGLYPKTAGHTAAQDAEGDVDTLIAAEVSRSGTASGRTSTQMKADAKSLFQGVAYLGVEDIIEYYSVYSRTITAATPIQVKASFEGVGMIWTTAELQAYEGIMPGGWFVMDQDAQWLKSRPEIQAVANQKTQITYSYTECQIAFGMGYVAYNGATLLLPPSA